MCVNRFSSFIDLAFNPYSNNFKSNKHFHKKLNNYEKIKVVVGTIFATLFTLGLGGLASFRCLVSVFVATKKKSSPATIPLNQFAQSVFNKSINEIDYNEIKYYSKDEVFVLLSSLFGKTAATSAMVMYRLFDQKKISSIGVHALLIGIVANLTNKDIDFIENNCQNSCVESLIKNIANKDPVERKIEVLSSLRNIPFLPRNPLVKDEIHRIGCQNQLNKDMRLLKACSWLDNTDINPNIGTYDLKKFSYTEYLAHRIIYGLEATGNLAAFQPGTLIPLRIYSNQAGEKQTLLMEAHRLITRNGLHAVVLIPSEFNSFKKDQDIPVQILFRGTKSAEAWNRNLNFLEKQQMYGWEGPGGASFNKNRRILLKNLNRILTLIPEDKSIKFEIFGHSLGACDAQRMTALLAETLETKQIIQTERSTIKKTSMHRRKIGEINLFCFNAPGVEESVNDHFLKNIEKLNKIKFQLRYFKVAHDPIQTAANQLLGYSSKEHPVIENLFISIFKLAKPTDRFIFTQQRAHTDKFLCNFTNLHKKVMNDAWIEFAKTNNPEDADIHQRGPNGDEIPKLAKYTYSSAFKALNNRGVWSRSLRSLLGIPKHNHQIVRGIQLTKTKVMDQLGASYRSISEKVSVQKNSTVATERTERLFMEQSTK